MKKILKMEILQLLASACSERITPGAVAAVGTVRRPLEGLRAWDTEIIGCGHTARYGARHNVSERTVYDLASLTKPLVTVPVFLHLVETGHVRLESTLKDLLPLTEIPADKKNIQLWQLLSHCSGLPPHRPYFVEALGFPATSRKSFYLQAVLAEKLAYSPGTQHLYSDLGYMLLGFSIEQLTGQTLDRYHRQHILQPLGIEGLLWSGQPASDGDRASFAATEVCPWTGKMLHGVVHDDNCRVMGGVAGHAGLFGTASGVLSWCMVLFEVWKGWRRTELFSRELVRRFLARLPGTTWTCGYDTPSTPVSSSGSFFEPKSSVGHLGFTGTSFWMDFEKEIVLVLLTNRVHPSRNNEKIKQFRPVFHNGVMMILVGS